MDPEEIKLEFFKRRKRTTMASVANDLGCTRTAVALVVERKSVSQRIAAAVAAAIGRPQKEVFPEYFNK